MRRDVVLNESINGSKSSIDAQYALHDDSQHNLEVVKLVGKNEKPKLRSAVQIFKEVFLPDGYPDSVSPDYLSYQVWDTVQAFCSSVSGTLAARAMFQTMGVGDEASTVYGATLTWLIKDGTGMIGRIMFAYYQGTQLDSNSKTWRLCADILNDASFMVDLVTPYFDKFYSIYFISFAGLLRSIVGVCGGATRSALTQHQAIRNNLADVSAKDGSQETLVNLIALVFNLLLLGWLKDDSSASFFIWPLFFLFVFGHLYANYRAVKSVIMRTFNRERFHIVCQTYFQNKTILSPERANQLEPVLFSTKSSFKSIRLGQKIGKKLTESQLDQLNSNNYCIDFDFNKKKASVLLHANASHQDLVKCLFHIELVDHWLATKSTISESESIKYVQRHFESFCDDLIKSNWSLQYTQFSPGPFRYSIDKRM